MELVSVHKSSSLAYVPPHAFPCFLCGLFSTGCSHPQCTSTCSSMGPSMGSRVDICSSMVLHGLQGYNLLDHGLLHGLQGNLCSSTWSAASPSLILVSAGLFHTVFFFPLIPLLFLVLMPFLKSVFPETSPSWLSGSAVPCGRSAGDGCNRLRQARGSPG